MWRRMWRRVRKQVVDAEKKRNVSYYLLKIRNIKMKLGLPLTEIIEELDESGNVISSKLDRPGGEAVNLLDALEKAGVDGIEEGGRPASTDLMHHPARRLLSEVLQMLRWTMTDPADDHAPDANSISQMANPLPMTNG